MLWFMLCIVPSQYFFTAMKTEVCVMCPLTCPTHFLIYVWRGEADGIWLEVPSPFKDSLMLVLCCFEPLLLELELELLPLVLIVWSWELSPPPVVSLESWSCSNDLTTSSMLGLNFGSADRHLIARWATLIASRNEYWPSTRASITWEILRLLMSNGLAQSTKLCSPDGLFLSNTRFPDMISRSTAPKLYTSLFLVKWPSQKDNGKKVRSEILGHFYSVVARCSSDYWLIDLTKLRSSGKA